LAKERGRFFAIARASAGEVSSILDIAIAYNLISNDDYNSLQALLLSIVKMLYRLR
jgi:four helix bundle protein